MSPEPRASGIGPPNLDSLRHAGLLDSSPEESFDRITRLVARLLGSPLAILSFIGEDRLFLKSVASPEGPWTGPRELFGQDTFSRKVVEKGEPLQVADVRRHPSFEESPDFQELGVVAYLGMPLIASGGEALGTLAVTDRVPRLWTGVEREILEDLAGAAASEAELKITTRRLESYSRAADRAAREAAEAGRRAEASERRLRELLEGLEAVVWEMELPDWRFTFVSRHARDLLGYPVDRWTREPGFWIEGVLHPEDRERIREECLQLLEEGRFARLQYRAVTAEGETIWLRDLVRVERDDRGEPLRLRGVMSDVTEQRKLQEQLHQVQRLEAVGRLAGGVAHDFNNLLTVVRANAELLLESLPEESPHREDVENIRSSADRATRLTRHLLAFGRRQHLEPRVVDLNRLLTEAEPVLERLVGEEGTLLTTPGPGPLRVQVDPGRLEEVFLNLVINARDALSPGGKIEITTDLYEPEKDELRNRPYLEAGSYVRIRVRDDGEGIDPEILDRVFEPFFTTRKEAAGTGLGLSTVYGIVKQSEGYVWAESEPGRGSEFTVLLPRSEEEERATEARPEREATEPGGETVLLVEDEPAVRSVARRILQRAEYRVLEAGSGEEAFGIFQDHRDDIHLLLTDQMMPGMSGSELAARLRAERPDLRVLRMSGYVGEEVDSDVSGADDAPLLEKPFSSDGLLEAVGAALGRSPEGSAGGEEGGGSPDRRP